jgi:hypothetical protein
MKLSIAIALTVSLGAALILLFTDFDLNAPINFGIMLTIRSFFFLCAILNISYCLYVLNKKGMNIHHRNILVSRHLSFCFLTCGTQTGLLLNYLQVSGKWDQPVGLQSATAIYFCCVPWVIFMLRITDPLIWKLNKKNFKYLFFCEWRNEFQGR